MGIFSLLPTICLVLLALAVNSSSGSDLLSPLPFPPLSSSPEPEITRGLAPLPSDPLESPNPSITPPPKTASFPPPPFSHVSSAPPPVNFERDAPSPDASTEKPPVDIPPLLVPVPASTPSRKSPEVSPVAPSPASIPRNAPSKSPIPEAFAPASISTPSIDSPPTSPAVSPAVSSILPPHLNPRNSSNDKAPTQEPILPVASPPGISKGTPPFSHPDFPKLAPTSLPDSPPMWKSPQSSPPVHPILPGLSPSEQAPDIVGTPLKSPFPSIKGKNNGTTAASPANDIPKPLPVPLMNHSSGSSPAFAPSTPKSISISNQTAPSNSSPNSPPKKEHFSLAHPPLPSHHRHHQATKIRSHAPVSSVPISTPPSNHQGHVFPPSEYIAPPPSPTKAFPFGSSSRRPKAPYPHTIRAFPPPPPNADCSSTICTEPYTNTPPGSPCGCVWPMQVELRLSIPLYTFFPLVSAFSQAIASGVFMKQSQVRIMGANVATEQPDKSIVLIDLVPLGEKIDSMTAFLIYQRFWRKKVVIDASLFGDYEVLYVRYPGLPSSPPLPPGMTIIDDSQYSGGDRNKRAIKPLGVDVPKKHHGNRFNSGTIAIIVLSASAFVGLCLAVAWILLFEQKHSFHKQPPIPRSLVSTLSKPSGSTRSITGSRLSSSLSFESSIAPYTGSAKTFPASEIERATDNFNESRVLGEGGFGRVYMGVLDDGTKVAVKVLKRDDQQGGREFLAEVEMLSRLHHRNLVNLIGICTEDRSRCLVYELIPNGSVESHLHGNGEESASLDWDARLKIALGAARGLAYLHEDSSPRVIHRDFKSSNILLEHDFTPKVSDFGLARNAMDEEHRHISTRVMGTFGYVAPEYAMTGHLLVKSDVYSYGVVLLELLTGRKPVDMSQLPGQENLVAWVRPLLTSKEGLEAIIDPSLRLDALFDSIAKVAAIASMCVQPEVAHRPFMGEVVQALKLVSNECDEAKEIASVNSTTQGSVYMGNDSKGSVSGHHQYPLFLNYDSEPDTERGLSALETFGTSKMYERDAEFESFRRHSSSGPFVAGRGKKLWQKIRRLSEGSVSEHGISLVLRPGSH